MKQLGIIIDKVSDERLKGSLVDVGVETSLEGNYIKVEEGIRHTRFILTLGPNKILKVAGGTNIGDAQRVLSTLESIGYKNVVLTFNGEEYKIDEENS